MAWVKLFRKPGTAAAGTGGPAGPGLGKSYQPGSMLSLALTKGLLNEPGQNSCFLNSAVQVLWQLDIFRRSLRQLSAHFCLGDACIFCALKSIFSQFQQSRERALPSDTLRHALAETFKDEQRFQLGLMDDAAECFENILERIHLHLVSDSAAETCTSKSCITHQKFAMTLYEQFVCRSCGSSSDPLPFTELVHYVSTTALCQQVERVLERTDRLRSDMFGELLQAANTIGDLRNCPVADVPLSGSKKLDCVRESAGSLRTNQGTLKQPLQSANRIKVLPESPGRLRESSQGGGGGGGGERMRRESDRTLRRPDSYQHKDMVYPRSSSPTENGLRSHSDQRHRAALSRPSRTDRSSFYPRGSPQESRSHLDAPGRRHESSSSGQYELVDGSERERSKPSWRPVREVLNVDRVLNELERRQHQNHQQHQQHGSPRCNRRRLGQERALAERKQKGLMTIYEDESRLETESRSSQESQRRATPTSSAPRPKGGASAGLRGDNWTIQRTESGYESSDRLSSGSTNPDSPGVENFAGKELRVTPEAQQTRGQVHHNRGDHKAEAVRSPLCHSKHLLKVQGRNSDHLIKGSPSSRRKQRYSSSCSSRKGSGSERDPAAPEQQDVPFWAPESPAVRRVARLSSSECNSSDETTNPPSEQEDSAYRSSTSETALPESPRPGRPARDESPLAARPKQGRTAPFRPRLLQEPSQTSPRPANHRRLDPWQASSDVSSKSGSDQERGESVASEPLDERSRGLDRASTSASSSAPQGPGVALTTYFNVDNCMTDTYRLKYHHQRPLVLAVPEQRGGVRGADHRETGHSAHMDALEHSKNRPETGPSSNKSTAKWHPVTPKGLDERGYL
ncbi:inactive ubiquitin carboxyl-terminal hydrolase 53 [Salminus brasiliensis]|uniref:inactive ubiquitin carboxyl-terminal hydrolase 53 n=1 Tax=Salminus brasiliensis TaxID=930266 RepID=UPI003B830FDE